MKLQDRLERLNSPFRSDSVVGDAVRITETLASIKKDMLSIIGKYETSSLRKKDVDAYIRDQLRAEQLEALTRLEKR